MSEWQERGAERRFSAAARSVLFHASQQATQLGVEGGLSTKHLLLALLDDANGQAITILSSLGITAAMVRAEVERQAEICDEAPRSPDELPILNDLLVALHHPSATFPEKREIMRTIAERLQGRDAIQLAYSYARQENAKMVDTGHLLMGLVMQEHGLAARALIHLEVTVSTIKRVMAAAQ